MPTGAMTHFGWGQEVTRGTAVAIAKFIDPTSADIDDSYPREAIPTMREDRSRVRSVSKQVECKGSFTAPLYFNALPWFFKFAIGPDTCIAAGTGWKHTLKGTTADLKSFTAEVGYTTAVGAKQLCGCLVDKLTVSMKAGEAAEVSCDFLGTVASKNAPATVSGLPADDNLGSFEMTSATFNAVSNLEIISAELGIENNLERVNTLNGTLYSRRVAEGFRAITLGLEMDFTSQSMYDLAVAGTKTPVVITVLSTVMAGGAGQPYKYIFTLPNVKFANVATPIEADGIMTQKLDSIVLFDGTATYDLQVEVVNTDAVYT